MAAFTTTVQKIGINGIHMSTSGGQIGFSTATTSITLTVADLNNVVIVAHNPSGADDITLTVSASTASRYIGKGIGDLVLTTSLNSSNYAFFGNLESGRFASTSNSITITATTAILIGAIEVSSTRQN